MAFTRFHDDPIRIEKDLLEKTFTGIYQLTTPGTGESYIEDPHIRLQKWGDSHRTNSFEINESLRRNKRLVHYDQPFDQPSSRRTEQGSKRFGTDETRATLPAWTFRDKNQTRKEFLLDDPQRTTWIPFDNNCPTRILEKDHYQSEYY
jgi:hypothetical protein